MWKRSGCEDRLRNLRDLVGEGRRLYVYGNYAYRLVFGLMGPLEHARGRRFLSHHEKRFNATLATCRIAVENAFGYVQQHWTYLTFAKGLRSGDQPVAAYFATAVLLSNALVCLRGCAISKRFNMPPLSVEAYFGSN